MEKANEVIATVFEEHNETENYKKFVEALVSSVSIDAIVEYVNGDEDDLLFTQMQDVVRKTVTNVFCPKCDSRLFYSDLPQYDYTCAYCDENFCECEVRK